MVRVCCICKLEYGIIADVSFHNIPRKEETKAKWVSIIGCEVKKHSAVCSRHFEERDFHYKVVGDHVRRFLLPTAIPSTLCIHSYSVNIKEENTDISDSDTDNSLTSHYNELSKLNNENRLIDTVENIEVNDCLIDKELNIQISKNLLENTDSSHSFKYIEDCKSHSSNSSFYSEDFTEKNNVISKTSKFSRKISESEAISTTKRTYTPRYIGDLKRENFTSDLSYEIVENYFNDTKKKRKVLNQKVKRLNDKIESLKSLLDYLKNNGYFSIKESTALDNYINKVNGRNNIS